MTDSTYTRRITIIVLEHWIYITTINCILVLCLILEIVLFVFFWYDLINGVMLFYFDSLWSIYYYIFCASFPNSTQCFGFILHSNHYTCANQLAFVTPILFDTGGDEKKYRKKKSAKRYFDCVSQNDLRFSTSNINCI